MTPIFGCPICGRKSVSAAAGLMHDRLHGELCGFSAAAAITKNSASTHKIS